MSSSSVANWEHVFTLYRAVYSTGPYSKCRAASHARAPCRLVRRGNRRANRTNTLSRLWSCWLWWAVVGRSVSSYVQWCALWRCLCHCRVNAQSAGYHKHNCIRLKQAASLLSPYRPAHTAVCCSTLTCWETSCSQMAPQRRTEVPQGKPRA